MDDSETERHCLALGLPSLEALPCCALLFELLKPVGLGFLVCHMRRSDY